MKKNDLEKLMKEKLVKDGISNKWIVEKMIFIFSDDIEESDNE